MHLIVDGYTSDVSKLKDKELLHQFLNDYPSAIGMTRISSPLVITYDGPKPQDWGLSGFVIIAESHISIHTFPERRFVNIDVFSCREFDSAGALDEIKRSFSLVSVKSWTLERGLEHYSPQQALAALEQERKQLRQEAQR